MHDVFISYASADRERAQQVAVALEHHGLQVWWDRQIPPGRTFDEVIEEAIDGARCVVVLWTRNSVASDWVKTEANEGAHDQRLVPAMLDMVKPPLEFRRIQAADLSRWTGDPGDPAFAPLLQAVSQRVRAGDETRQASASDSEAAQSPANARPPPPADRPVTRASAPAAPASRRTVGLLAGLGALVVIGVTSRWWLPTPVQSVLPAVVPAVVLPASAPPPSTPAAQAPAASAPEPEAAARVEMPKLTGQTVEQARGALRALGLSVALQERASTSAKAGTVVAQTPAAGSTVEPGAMVTLTIASVPVPSPAPRATAPTPDAAPAAAPAPAANSRLASLKRETADSKQQFLQAEKAGQEAVVAFKQEGERLKALISERVTVPIADLLRRAANQATEIGRTLQGVEQAADVAEAKMKAALARWPAESAPDAEAQAAQVSAEVREAARTEQSLVEQVRSQLAVLRRVNTDLQSVTPQQLQTEVCQSLARNNRVVEGPQLVNYMRNCQLAQARAPACWRTAEARGLNGAARDSFMGECHRRPG